MEHCGIWYWAIVRFVRWIYQKVSKRIIIIYQILCAAPVLRFLSELLLEEMKRNQNIRKRTHRFQQTGPSRSWEHLVVYPTVAASRPAPVGCFPPCLKVAARADTIIVLLRGRRAYDQTLFEWLNFSCRPKKISEIAFKDLVVKSKKMSITPFSVKILGLWHCFSVLT